MAALIEIGSVKNHARAKPLIDKFASSYCAYINSPRDRIKIEAIFVDCFAERFLFVAYIVVLFGVRIFMAS